MINSSLGKRFTPITFECILPHIQCDKHTYEVGMANDMAILFTLQHQNLIYKARSSCLLCFCFHYLAWKKLSMEQLTTSK
jgi:hypothetical protein